MIRSVRWLGVVVVCLLISAGCSSGGVAGPGEEAGDATVGVTPPAAEDLDAATAVPTSTPEPDNSIRVGVLLDVGNLEGENRDPGNVMSPFDRPAAIAFEAAAGALNAEGGLLGRPIVLDAVDTTSRLSVIDHQAARMIEDGAQLLVVTCEFDFARPAIEQAEAAGVIVISPCAGETGWASGDAGPLAFSMVPPPDTYGVAMADFAWDQGYRDLAVISDATAPEATAECDAFRDRWRTLGGTFSFNEAVSLRAAESLDSNPDVASIGAAEAIVVCAFRIIGFELLLQVRMLGFEAPILASPSLDTGNWLPLDISTAASGAADLGDFRLFTLASVWGDDPRPAVQQAIDQYIAAQAIPPNSGRFVTGSDVAAVWAEAVERAGTTDGEAVAREIRQMSDVEGVSGPLSFAGRQAPVARDLRVMRHRNGVYAYEALVTATSAG